MTSFNKVVLLGKGLLGSAILEQLVDNSFTVTVFSRDPAGVKGLPSGVEAVQVDYSSHDSLVAAFQGQDVAIATFGSAAIGTQPKIIDAAIEAGVKRYIPADWGSLTTDSKARNLPTNFPFIQVQDYLKKKAEEGALEYTIFSVGAFLNYVLDFPFILDLRTHSIQIYDDGQHPFSSTSVASIGKTVAGALKNSEATKNRNVLIHETVLTQAKVLALAKKYSPPGVEWAETRLDSKQELEQALKNLEKDPTDFNLIFPLLKSALLGGKYRAAYPEVDNESVSVPLLTDEDLEERFAAKFENA